MKTPSIQTITVPVKHFGGLVKEYSPTILTGVAVAGFVGTVAAVATGTIKAKEIVDMDFEERADNTPEDNFIQEATPVEIVKMTWHCYVPAAILGAVTVGSIIGAHAINMKRNVALAALYSGATKALEEYQAKTKEIVGKNKEEKIREALAEDKMMQYPVDKHSVIMTGYGDTLCYDVMSGRYFKHDIQKIQQAQNTFNHQLLGEYALSLNDFYDHVGGLDHIRMGDDIGWNCNKLMELEFHSKLASDGTPCLVIDYKIAPSFMYQDY